MSNLPIRLAAVAAIFTLPLVGLAQGTASTPAGQPAASSAGQSAPSASTGAQANTSATTSAPTQPLAAGMTVKDNTGATIGQIAKLDTDASGKTMATIKMGADAFQAPATALAVADGAATINLTKAQIDAQLHPKKS